MTPFNAARRLIEDDDGATMVEYAIMVGFIAAVCIGVVAMIGASVLNLFESIPAF